MVKKSTYCLEDFTYPLLKVFTFHNNSKFAIRAAIGLLQSVCSFLHLRTSNIEIAVPKPLFHVEPASVLQIDIPSMPTFKYYSTDTAEATEKAYIYIYSLILLGTDLKLEA